MPKHSNTSGAGPTAVVTGAAGQDGGFLVRRLVREGFRVHAVVRTASSFPWRMIDGFQDQVELHELDFRDPEPVAALIARVSPVELYNLAGLSSVSQSFREPELTWMTNATVVAHILEALRTGTPSTRMYQASSSEMFGWIPGGSVVHREDAPFLPQSPYAAAKAAAHMLCTTYRRVYGLRVACGILFNHESRRRGSSFLTRKVTDHVRMLRSSSDPLRQAPLVLGNLKVRRDWGFAPDYVDGMCRILRQVEVRAKVAGLPLPRDEGSAYRDYVLGTGQTHAVWELVGRAFELGGFQLTWELAGDDPLRWTARFTPSGVQAVVVDATLLRPSDPLVIQADAEMARTELGWAPRPGLDSFLTDMLMGDSEGEPH